MGGGVLALRCLKTPNTSPIILLMAGASLVLLSELLYPPVAGAFLFPFLIHALFSPTSCKSTLLKGVGSLAILMLAYFFILFPLRELAGAEAFGHRLHRTNLDSDLLGKTSYLIHHWILGVLGFWGGGLGFWNGIVLIVCAFLIGTGLWHRLRGLQADGRLLLMAGIAGAFFLMCGPFLILRESHENYRILFPAFVMGQLLLCQGIFVISGKPVRWFVMAAVMAFFTIGAGLSVKEGMIRKNAELLRISQKAILEADTLEGPPYYFALPEDLMRASSSGWARFEFGGWDTPNWAVEALAGLLIDEHRGITEPTRWPDVRVLRLPGSILPSPVQGFGALALIPLQAGEAVALPLLGEQTQFTYRGTRYLSGFMGTVEILSEESGFIELASSRYGRLSVTGDNPENLWVFREDVGWVWTSLNHFPAGWTKESVEKVIAPLD